MLGLICVNLDDFSHLVLYLRQAYTHTNCINQDVQVLFVATFLLI